MNTMNEVREKLDVQKDRCLSCRYLGEPNAGGVRCCRTGSVGPNGPARWLTAWCLQFVAFHQESYLDSPDDPNNTCRFYSQYPCGQYERASQ